MNPELSGKICLVTGASRGVGKGIALQLAAAGATVYITGRNTEDLEQCAREMKQRGCSAVHAVQVDHSDEDEVKALFDQIRDEQDGKLDILVNNAFSAVNITFENLDKPFWSEDPAPFWDIYNNAGLRNHFICSSYAAKMMQERKTGIIFNISSIGGLRYLFNVPYGVGKCALDRMTQDTAHELRGHNVAVVGLWPGPVKTEYVNRKLMDNSKVSKRIKTVYAHGETIEFSGKCVAHLAEDPAIMKKSGRILFSVDVANEYKFTEDDGTMPFDTMCLKSILHEFKYEWLAYYTPEFVKIPKPVIYLAGYKF